MTWLTFFALVPITCRRVESEAIIQPASGSTCSLTSVAIPVRSVDGKRLYTEPQSLTLTGGDVVVIGAPIVVQDEPGAPARKDGGAVAGVRIGKNGRATVLAAPAGWHNVASPRVLYEPAFGWHAVWADQSSDTASGSVELVYGLFDGHRWTRMRPIGRFGRSWWGPSSPSKLIRAKDGLALAGPVNQGTTLLTERDAGWRATPVPPAHSAAYSALIAEHGDLVLAYAGYDASDSVGLAVTRSSDGGASWSSPLTVSLGAAYDPALVRLGDTLALIWLTGRQMLRPQGILVSLSSNHGASWSQPATLSGAEDANRFSYATVLRDNLLLVAEVDSLGTTRHSWHLFDRSGRPRRLPNQGEGVRWATLASDGGRRAIMLASTGAEGALVSVLSNLTLSCQP